MCWALVCHGPVQLAYHLGQENKFGSRNQDKSKLMFHRMSEAEMAPKQFQAKTLSSSTDSDGNVKTELRTRDELSIGGVHPPPLPHADAWTPKVKRSASDPPSRVQFCRRCGLPKNAEDVSGGISFSGTFKGRCDCTELPTEWSTQSDRSARDIGADDGFKEPEDGQYDDPVQGHADESLIDWKKCRTSTRMPRFFTA